MSVYDVESFQIMGPEWLQAVRFDMQASFPAGTAARQYHQMLRTMLAERLGLLAHRETKTSSGFALMVAKGGSKLRLAESDTTAGDSPLDTRDTLMGAGTQYGLRLGASTGGNLRMEFTKMPMAALAIIAVSWANAPMLDETGLLGRYQGSFEFAFNPADRDGSFLEGVSQLGLRVEKRNVPVEMLIIDHIERTPSAN